MKRTYSLLIFLLCTFLISNRYLTSLSLVGAQSNENALNIGISSYGTITPTPTPTPTPGGNNIATIPSYWTNKWRGIGGDPYIYYPVTWQGQTCIKISPDPNYAAWAQSCGWMGLNELDGMTNNVFTPVKPGDHVVFKAWIWVEPSTVGRGGGLYMAIDIGGANGRIEELQGANAEPVYPTPPSEGRLLVSWGSSHWVQLTIDFIVQNVYYGDHNKDIGGGYQGYDRGEAATPTWICPWFQLLNFESYEEGASAYVYGTELYINP
jgi:hypothetical protein